MEAPQHSLDEGTKRFLNGLRTPVWIVDFENELQVFANERAGKIASHIFGLECVDNRNTEKINTLGVLLKETIQKGGQEFKGTFVVEGTAMKASFMLSPVAGNERTLVMIEAQNFKKSKDFDLSPSEYQTSLWSEVKTKLPYAEAILVMYSMKTGKVVLYNKWAKEKLPKEVLEYGGDNNGVTSATFLPYIVDRTIVDKIVRKLQQGENIQLNAEVRLANAGEHFFLLERTLDPTNGEDLVVCYEEDITSFVAPKKQSLLKALSKPQPEFTAMLGMSEMLVNTFLSKEYASPDLLRGSSETLLKIINMFDLCKIEEGNMALDIAEFDIYTTIEDCVEFACSLAKSKGLDIALYTPPNLPNKLIGDSRRLKHVLLNFISNAIKFSKGSGGEILVNLVLIPAEIGAKHITLHIEVVDQGVGVAKENLVDLFLDWSVVATSYKSNKETGIGLAISKQLVEMMGGTIGARSKLGEGSTFWCDVPLETIYRVGVPPCAYKLLPTNLSGIRVLIVGDESKNEAQILSKYLTEWGLQTTIVASASACLDKLGETPSSSSEPYELVFISQSIPDMKPFKLHKMIDRNSQFGLVHACVLTNKRKLGDRLSTQPVPIRRSKLHDYLGKFAARRHLYKKAITPAQERKDIADAVAPRDINVLVVEDNAMAQVFASRILRKTGGYKVDSVTNGKQAVEAFKKGTFDIILMDCQMPELDGYSATKQIRDLEKETGGHVIIIAVTAMTMQEDRDRCFQMGMDDYLSKPVTNKDLVQKITQWSKQTRINKEEVEFGEFNTQQPAHKQMRPSSTLFGSKRFDSAFPIGTVKDRLLM